MNSLAYNRHNLPEFSGRIYPGNKALSKKTETGLRLVKANGRRLSSIYGTIFSDSIITNNIGIAAKGIASDFNNILTGIIDNINFALLESDKEIHSSAILDLAQIASNHAETMITKLANLSKPSRTRKTLVSISELLKQSILANTKGLSINVKTNIPEEILCRVVKTQMRAVFDNILTNSVQSISDKGLLRIKARRTKLPIGNHLLLLPGDYLKISFHDNGGGILQDDIDRVFDPFFTTKSIGRGLGLTSALSVVMDHHGQMEVESITGLGTTVNVYIPL